MRPKIALKQHSNASIATKSTASQQSSCQRVNCKSRANGAWLVLLACILWRCEGNSLRFGVKALAGDYLGASLGKLNSYSNQISGDVFVINDHTFFIKNFFYDGLAQDAFFWAGSTIRPSNRGFIVASEDGRTNKLQRYTNRDITIRLPDERRISGIKWLAVFDVRSGKSLADILISDDFEAPSAKKISELSSLARGVRSATVTLLDSRSVGIEQLHYDGSATSAHFLVGIGPQPSLTSGQRVPDETGALEPLGAYNGESIVLELPGNLTIFDIDWLAIYDTAEHETLGSVLIPSHLSVPPALVSMLRYESRLPQCEQLHRDVQLNWDVFGPQITFELVARIAANDYIAFGISGSENASTMVGADRTISYVDAHLGFTHDYNITDKHPCVALANNQFRGVCPDAKLVGGVDNYQLHSFSRENGLTKITSRRNLLNTGDDGDRVYKTAAGVYTSVVWAVGRLNKFKEPRYHHAYSRAFTRIEFGRRLSKNCFQFATHSIDSMQNANDVTSSRRQLAAITSNAASSQSAHLPQSVARSPFNFLTRFSLAPSAPVTSGAGQPPSAQTTEAAADWWPQSAVVNKTASVFYARVGHPGVHKGYLHSNADGSPGLVWYINGLMAPVLHVSRGRTYTFRVEGGDSLESGYRFYHPLYITDDRFGGYAVQNLTEKLGQKVWAGLAFERLAAQSEAEVAALKAGKAAAKLNKPAVAQQVRMLGKPAPHSAGRLCAWLPANGNDVRKADSHESFAQFRAKLSYSCATSGEPGIVVFAPNVSTPDIVYYQSFSQRNMGGRIIVHDESESSDES